MKKINIKQKYKINIVKHIAIKLECDKMNLVKRCFGRRARNNLSSEFFPY